MKQPNFFIIGASKCGTTSLAAWLAEHTNIFMSPVKEPHFFNTDLGNRKLTRREYEMLFTGATDEHKAIGEASTSYLFSQVAVPRIEKELPGSRYIVMVRNPIDMAYSFHEELCALGYENVKDFAKAWRLSDERAKGHAVSRWCHEPRLLNYKSVCRLGEQIGRLIRIVPRNRVLVLVLDDIKENPHREYQKVLDFVGVPSDCRIDFSVHNPAKERRWPWVRQAVLAVGRLSNIVKRVLSIPVVRGTGLLNALDRLSIRYRSRPPMPQELQTELIEYFREDILLLSHLIVRDLSTWLKVKERTTNST